MSSIHKKGKNYFYYHYVGHVQKTFSLGVSNKKSAEYLKQKLDFKFANEKFDLTLETKSILIDTLFYDYIRFFSEKSDSWIYKVDTKIRIFKSFFAMRSERLVEDVSNYTVSEYIKWRKSNNTADKTISDDLSYLRMIINFAGDNNYKIDKIKWTMFKDSMNVKSTNHYPYYSKSQIDSLWEWDVKRRGYYMALYYTGLRSMDVVSLTANHIRSKVVNGAKSYSSLLKLRKRMFRLLFLSIPK